MGLVCRRAVAHNKVLNQRLKQFRKRVKRFQALRAAGSGHRKGAANRRHRFVHIWGGSDRSQPVALGPSTPHHGIGISSRQRGRGPKRGPRNLSWRTEALTAVPTPHSPPTALPIGFWAMAVWNWLDARIRPPPHGSGYPKINWRHRTFHGDWSMDRQQPRWHRAPALIGRSSAAQRW